MPYLVDKTTGQRQFVDRSSLGGTQQTTGSATSGMDPEILRQILLQAAIQSPKDASKYATILNLATPATASADKEKQQSQAEIERIITGLEDMYFFSDRGPLTYGVPGELGRLSARMEQFNAQQRADYNPELLNYMSQRDSIRPKFVKAMGDSGNFSDSEQKKAVNSIPTGLNSPTEALQFFAWTRNKFGLQARDIEGELNKSGSSVAIKGNGDMIELNLGSTKTGGTQTGGTKTTSKAPTSLPTIKDLPEEQEKIDTIDVSLPNLPYTELGGLLGMYGGTIGTFMGTAAGKTVSDINEKGLPLTKEAYQRDYGGFGQQLKDTAAPATVAAVLQLLLTGGIKDFLGKGRSALANQYGNVSTQPVVEGLEQFASKSGTATTSGRYAKLLEEAKKIYGGEISVPDLITKKSAAGTTARLTGGGVGRATSAKFAEEERRLLNMLQKQYAPLTKIPDVGFQALSKAGNIGNSALNKLLIPAAMYLGLRKAQTTMGY